MTQRDSPQFVSRAGLKLDHALTTFDVDVTGLSCADFGCNVGGFTDCLLQRSAAKVYAIDTGYGVLDYRLRSDDRVVVMERTNALHADPPRQVDLVVIDLAWTPQRYAIPAALRWLKPGGRIVTLIKPHYELTEAERKEHLRDGRLDPAMAEHVMQRVVDEIPDHGDSETRLVRVTHQTISPITGGKSSRKARRGKAASGGNVEYLALIET